MVLKINTYICPHINNNKMTKLKKLHAQIDKEYQRIDMLKRTLSSGSLDFYDFINAEIAEAKDLIAKLKAEFNLEYIK